jgi:3-isopropylmalate/(R)-2-methylmalate dehydratase small subunit
MIRGKVYVVGDNIDTDQIIPAQYLNLVPTIPEEYRELGSLALSGLPEDCPPFVDAGTGASPYTVIIAGRNFGCGSSREHAPIALGAAGVAAVVAESYARIFYRNAVATAELYPLESTERLCEVFSTGQTVEIDLEAGIVHDVQSAASHTLAPLGAVAPIIRAGGLFAYARGAGIVPSAGHTAT